MFSFLTALALVPVAVAPAPQEIVQTQEVRALPGQLDKVPVFNSNSPEVVQTEGILLSTFPGKGKANPKAHLNFAFTGRFDLFAHHIARPQSGRDYYLGVLLHNPGSRPVTVLTLQANSYLSNKADAPFIDLPAQVESPLGRVYAGPGSRVSSDVLRRRLQAGLPVKLEIPPGESRMLANLAMPTSSGRSTLMRLWSNGNLYAASMAMEARTTGQGQQAPTLQEWKTLLMKGDLVQPRDRVPTPPKQTGGQFIYGRVAGVSQGSQWRGTLTNGAKAAQLTVPKPGQAISYALNTLHHGTLGTNQIQTAPMLVRYPDTAYYAHGNYGVYYNLTLPLHNNTQKAQTITLAIQTPIKENRLAKGGLRFYQQPGQPVFFRGSVRLRYQDAKGQTQVRYVHLVQQRGQQGKPILTLELPPGTKQSVEVDLLYPPDATPPQVLTIKTL
jgi:hypothetical protein